MVQVFFFINRKIQPHLWMHPDIPCESQNLIGDPDATKTTLLQIRFLFHLQSKRVDVHLRRNHGWKFTIFTNVLDLKKREKSERFWVFGDGRKHGWHIAPIGTRCKEVARELLLQAEHRRLLLLLRSSNETPPDPHGPQLVQILSVLRW